MNSPSEKPSPNNVSPDSSDLDGSAREDRLRALRSMLAATEARQKQVKRVRHQALTAGLSISILTGEKQGLHGVILDADYIHSRVLVQLRDDIGDIWLNFTDVSPIAEPNEKGSNSLLSE